MKKTKPIVFDTLEENLTFIADLEREYKALEKGIKDQKDLLAKAFCPHKKGDKLLINLQGHTITVKVDEVVYAKGKIDGFYAIWGKPVGKRTDIFKNIESVYVSKQEEIVENLTKNKNGKTLSKEEIPCTMEKSFAQKYIAREIKNGRSKNELKSEFELDLSMSTKENEMASYRYALDYLSTIQP